MEEKKGGSREFGMTFIGKAVRLITRVPLFLLKALYILPFLLFGIWLIQMVYSPHATIMNPLAAVKAVKVVEDEDIFKQILTHKDAVPRDHFHMVDEYISQPEPPPPLCIRCHGTYPHRKEKKVRSLLNLHNGFLACSVCHARKKLEDKDIVFKCVDHETGKLTTMGDGEYGKYSGKIFPVKLIDGKPKRLFRPVSEKAAQQYLKFQDSYSPDQIAMAKIKLHENISSKPVFCSDCHKKDGYLDFAELGFSKNRVYHLISTEVVGMIEKYKTFYLPSQIDFAVEGALQ